MIVRALLLAGVLLAVGAAPALADDVYVAHTCRGPGGEPAAPDGWAYQGGVAARRADCLTGGEIGAGPALAPFARLDFLMWRFVAPPDTRIVGWTMYRTIHVSRAADNTGWNWSVRRDENIDDPAHIVERCYQFNGCFDLGDGRISDASRVGESGQDFGSLLAVIDCNPGPCAAGTPTSMRILRADFTLRDTADPTFVGTPSGDLLDTARPVAGVRGVSFSAADKGGGVYQATLEVDGRPAVSQVVDDNGGRCRKPFTAAVPCRGTVSGSLSLDTAALPDGAHSVRVLVSDPTESNVAAFGPVQITTANRSPECDPAAARAPETPVLASFHRSRRRTITRRSTRSLRVAGRIAGAGSGVTVHLLSRDQRSGAPAALVATAETGAGGSFALQVPRGPSRRLRAAYRARPTDPFLTCSRPLNVRVPARATLRASLRGRRVRLTGRLLGGHVPRRGKLIDLQARDGGRWRVFATVRTDSRGRFRAGYRFSRRARGTYPMRVRVRADASYPFARGYSPVVRVRVRVR